MKDKYVGLIIRDYEVLERLDYDNTIRPNSIRYRVKCIHCQEIKEVTRQTLYNGKREQGNNCVCICTRSGISPGDVFGRLTVLYRNIEDQEYGRTSWNCRCECGKEKIVKTKDLKSGRTKSCGCLEEENRKSIGSRTASLLENLTGEKSGLLTVLRQATLEETSNRPKGKRYWYCSCECGGFHIVSTSDFLYKKVLSCGCLKSKGEQKISALLKENNILFQKQYSFADLKNNKKHYLFDFAVIDKDNNLLYLIEYDGIQHIDPKRQFGNNEETIEIIRKRDNIKNNYCFLNKIPLIRIPYTHYDNIQISDLILESSKYIIMGDEVCSLY